MKILVTGAAGFIGFHLCRRIAGKGDEVLGIDSISSYYDPSLKYGRLSELGISRAAADSDTISCSTTLPGFSFLRRALEESAGVEKAFLRAQFRQGLPPGRAGRCALQHRQPARLPAGQSGWLSEHSGRMPGLQDPAPRFWIELVRLRPVPTDSFQRARRCGPSHELLRGHKKSQRDDGACVQSFVRNAMHRAALFHGLWPLGQAGHGILQVRKGHCRRRTHGPLQLGRHDA